MKLKKWKFYEFKEYSFWPHLYDEDSEQKYLFIFDENLDYFRYIEFFYEDWEIYKPLFWFFSKKEGFWFLDNTKGEIEKEVFWEKEKKEILEKIVKEMYEQIERRKEWTEKIKKYL